MMIDLDSLLAETLFFALIALGLVLWRMKAKD